LLFTYFGISEAWQSREREATIKRNIALKKRMRRDFLKKTIDPDLVLKHPWEKFEIFEAIIHSVDDTSYPDASPPTARLSGWFKVELFDFYHNGLEVIVGIEYAIVDEGDRWSLIDAKQEFDKSLFEKVKVYRIGCVPFRNIVEYDIDGDEYYSSPHIYCQFSEGGTPYEEYRFRLVHDGYPYALCPERQFHLKSKSNKASRG